MITMDNETFFSNNHYEERAFLASIVLLISIIGSTGNLLVIVAVALSKTLRTKTNVFVLNLSVADISACFAMPWFSVALLSGDEWLLPKAEWLCQTAGMVVFISIGCSLWTLTFIAVNRLFIITKPLATYQMVYSPLTIAIMLIFSWVVR